MVSKKRGRTACIASASHGCLPEGDGTSDGEWGWREDEKARRQTELIETVHDTIARCTSVR